MPRRIILHCGMASFIIAASGGQAPQETTGKAQIPT
jgi:hypothetical protein